MKITASPDSAARVMSAMLPIIVKEQSMRRYYGIDPNLVINNEAMAHPQDKFPSDGVLLTVEFNDVADAFNFQNKVSEALNDSHLPAGSAGVFLERDLYHAVSDGKSADVRLDHSLAEAIRSRVGKRANLTGADLTRIGLDSKRINIDADGQLRFIPQEKSKQRHGKRMVELSGADIAYLDHLAHEFLGKTQSDLCLQSEKEAYESVSRLSAAIKSGNINAASIEFSNLSSSSDPGKMARRLDEQLRSGGIRAHAETELVSGRQTTWLTLQSKDILVLFKTGESPIAYRKNTGGIEFPTPPRVSPQSNATRFKRLFGELAAAPGGLPVTPPNSAAVERELNSASSVTPDATPFEATPIAIDNDGIVKIGREYQITLASIWSERIRQLESEHAELSKDIGNKEKLEELNRQLELERTMLVHLDPSHGDHLQALTSASDLMNEAIKQLHAAPEASGHSRSLSELGAEQRGRLTAFTMLLKDAVAKLIGH